MAYTNHFDGKMRADASLNDHHTNEKYRGSSGEPVSLGPWNMDRGRSYSDIQSSPAAHHRTPATSPASLGSENQTSRRLLKHITCAYWYWSREGCKKSSEDCYYAHAMRPQIADLPVQVELGSELLFFTSLQSWCGARADYNL